MSEYLLLSEISVPHAVLFEVESIYHNYTLLKTIFTKEFGSYLSVNNVRFSSGNSIE